MWKSFIKRFPRYPLIYAFIIFTFMPIFHYNIVSPYIIPNPQRSARLQNRLAREVYLNYARVVTKAGVKTGLARIWKMYTPAMKAVVFVEWHAMHPDGDWVYLDTPDFSAAYWERRNWLTVRFRDFKEPLLNAHLVQPEARSLHKSYARYLCREAKHRLGWQPVAIKGIRKAKKIPRPSDAKEWSPFATDGFRELDYPIVRCP